LRKPLGNARQTTWRSPSQGHWVGRSRWVAIVIGGLMFMFGEGGPKRQISGIVFGGGLALFAGQFLTWLF
jgi:Na+/phosphate symporter